jgi:chemotaxis protein MotB
VLILVGGGGLFAFTQVQSAKAQAEDARSELAALKNQAASAEKRAADAEAQVAFSKEKIVESEASLAKAKAAAESKEQAASELETKLKSLLEEGQGEVLKGKDGRLTLQLVDKVLFRSGEAELTKRGQRVIGRVGKALKAMTDKQVWVQGHTDDVPVSEDNEQFKSNWELSAARALTVVHFLQHESEVDPKRLAAAAFGSHRPVSRKKKAKNRRIEIVLFPLEVKLRR